MEAMVGCVVVNWNGWRDTLACLRTLAAQTHQPLHVFVVDNGSTDDSVARICAFFEQEKDGPTRFTLLLSPENVGFARGANIGVREALKHDAGFVWLLNNDTECPPDTLSKLIGTAESHPNVGIVGTVLYYHSDPAKVQAWGGGHVYRWFGVTTHHYKPARQAAGSYTTFASALFRAKVLRDVGLLYEGFFMYYDDSDFCLRMEKTHWTMAVADSTAVLHKESASTEGPHNPFMEKTIAMSGMKFLQRHSPVPWLSIPCFVLLKLMNRARKAEWAATRAVVDGYREFRRGSAVVSSSPARDTESVSETAGRPFLW